MRKAITDNYPAFWLQIPGMLLCLLLIGIVPLSTYAQVDTNAKIKSLFIYNFSKYVEWPSEMREGNFVIGIYGDYPSLSVELNRMASLKKKGNQTIEIANFNATSTINKCHILFVSSQSSDQLDTLIKEISGKNILLVADGEGLAKKGAGISLYDSQNKQRMEINPGNVEKYKLKISSQLMALATVVN